MVLLIKMHEVGSPSSWGGNSNPVLTGSSISRGLTVCLPFTLVLGSQNVLHPPAVVRNVVVQDSEVLDTAVRDAVVWDAAVLDAAVWDALVWDVAVQDAVVRDTTVWDAVFLDAALWDTVVWDTLLSAAAAVNFISLTTMKYSEWAKEFRLT